MKQFLKDVWQMVTKTSAARLVGVLLAFVIGIITALAKLPIEVKQLDNRLKTIESKVEVHDRKIVSIELRALLKDQKDSLRWERAMEIMMELREGQKNQADKFDKFIDGYYHRLPSKHD